MPTQGFTVLVDGAEADIERVEVQGSSVSLDLEMADYVEHGEVVTVSYAPPTAGVLQDALGNKVTAIAADDVTVRNNVPDPNETDPPEVRSASVLADGSVIRVVFSEPLSFSELPPGAVAGLAETARAKDSITWSWMAPAAIDNVAGAPKWYEWRIREVFGSWGARRRITGTTIKVTGLSAETWYDIEVRAGNDAGPGQSTQDRAQTTADLPEVPIAVTVRSSSLGAGRGVYVGLWLSSETATVPTATKCEMELLRNGSYVSLVCSLRTITFSGTSRTAAVAVGGDNTWTLDEQRFGTFRVRLLDNADNPVSQWTNVPTS